MRLALSSSSPRGASLAACLTALALALAACGSENSSNAPPAAENPDAGAPPAVDSGPPGDPCTDAIEWTQGPELPVAVDHHHTFVSTLGGGPALYVLGGEFNASSLSNGVFRAAIRDDGSLDAFEQVGTLPQGRAGAALIVDGATVVLAGGATGTLPTSTVVIGTLTGNGRIDAWTRGPDLPGARFHTAGVLVGGRAYVTGGTSTRGFAHDSVFFARLEGGKLDAWTAGTALPEPRSHHATFVQSGAILIAGGLNGNSFNDEWEPTDDLIRIALGADGAPEAAVTVRPKGWFNATTHALTPLDRCFVTFGGGTTAVRRFSPEGEPIDAGAADFPAARQHVHQVPFHRGFFYATAGRQLGRPRNLVWIGRARATR